MLQFKIILLGVGLLCLISIASGFQRHIRLYHNHTNTYSGVDGVVQIYKNHSWSFVNGSDWDFTDAMVFCRELGFRGVANFSNCTANFTIPVTPSGREKRGLSLTKFLPTIISGLECIGKEEKISKCAVGAVKDVATVLANENFRTSAPGSTIPIPNVSQVSCTGFQTVRLSGGSGPHEGRVEVFFNRTWGTVCDDYWEKKDADVLCRQLGYNYSLSALGEAAFGSGSSRKIWIDNLNCVGNETDLMLCNRSRWGEHNCLHSEDASAICKPPTNCSVLPTTSNGTASSNSTYIGARVNFTCDDGYVILGRKQLTCLSTGRWNDAVPLCLKRSMVSHNARRCPSLPSIAFGSMSNSDTAVGNVVRFKCAVGYMLVGSEGVKCTEMGVWSGMPPICFYPQAFANCPMLSSVKNGRASTFSTAFNTEVHFTCDPGYVMVGYSTINCIMTRGHGTFQWNGAPPYCISNSSKLSGDTGHSFMVSPPNMQNQAGMSNTPQDSGKRIVPNKVAAAVLGSLGGLVALLIISVLVVAVVIGYKKYEQRKLDRNTHIEELAIPLVNTSEDNRAETGDK